MSHLQYEASCVKCAFVTICTIINTRSPFSSSVVFSTSVVCTCESALENVLEELETFCLHFHVRFRVSEKLQRRKERRSNDAISPNSNTTE